MVTTRRTSRNPPSQPVGMVTRSRAPPPPPAPAKTLRKPRKRKRRNSMQPSSNLENYEKFREERIKENRERMIMLGILDVRQQLNLSVDVRHKSGSKNPNRISSAFPPRRSLRLQHASSSDFHSIETREGVVTEVYGDDHGKLLGSYKTPWILFVDGYDSNGKRIHDPVNGKTCHQCRQKTIGHRTSCNKCKALRGQLCGDCLFTRYGENVLEVEKNPDWICPVCRDICNCSICRVKKGWAPTGSLYKKVENKSFDNLQSEFDNIL